MPKFLKYSKSRNTKDTTGSVNIVCTLRGDDSSHTKGNITRSFTVQGKVSTVAKAIEKYLTGGK